MRVALVTPYSYTYPGGVGRHVEALAQELMELGHDVRLLAPVRPRRPDRAGNSSRRTAAAAAPARSRGADGPHPRPADERRGVEPRDLPQVRRPARPRAPPRRLRRRPCARAERPVPELVRHRGRQGSGGRHVPYLLNQRVREPLRGELHRRAAAVRQAERAHRRVRGGAVDRAALLRRPLPHRPERGGPVRGPAGRLAPAQGPPDRLRGPRRRAQGPARAAARVRGAPRCRRPGEADPRRPNGGGGRADAARLGGHRDRGPGRRRHEVEAARRGGHPVRSVARRGELRDGPHRGVRLGHSGRRLRHCRLPRGRAERPRRRARAGRRRGRARRDAARARVRPGAAHADVEGRARARGALRVAERGARGGVGVRGRARACPSPTAA